MELAFSPRGQTNNFIYAPMSPLVEPECHCLGIIGQRVHSFACGLHVIREMVLYKPPLSFTEALRFGSSSLPEQILLTQGWQDQIRGKRFETWSLPVTLLVVSYSNESMIGWLKAHLAVHPLQQQKFPVDFDCV